MAPAKAREQNGSSGSERGVLCYLVNVAWYFELHWQERARSAVNDGWEVHLLAGQIEEGTRKALEFQGIHCHEIPLARGSFNPFKLLGTLLHTRRLLRLVDADILHCITLLPNLIGGAIVKRKRTPVICSITGTGWVFSGDTGLIRFLRSIVIAWFRWIARNPSLRLVFENSDDLALFKELGIARNDNERLILGAGVDTNLYSPDQLNARAEFHHPVKEPITFLFASRFLYSKGLKELVEAMTAIYDQGYNCCLRVCGFEDSGNPESIPTEVLNQWRSLPFVEWLGKRRDMAAVLQNSDVLVLPTCYGEGVPRILIEASSCGVACIATDVAGCREIVKDGVNGLLVEPGRKEALESALKYFAESPETAQIFGEAGRTIVLEKFDQIYVNAETLALYDSMA